MIRNVHERVINAPIEALGALLDGLGQKDDRLWPSQSWTPMVLDACCAASPATGSWQARAGLMGSSTKSRHRARAIG